MVNGKYTCIFNVHWPNSLGLIEGFCTVCKQPWVDLNPQPFAQKATTLTTAPRRPHTKDIYTCIYIPRKTDEGQVKAPRPGPAAPIRLSDRNHTHIHVHPEEEGSQNKYKRKNPRRASVRGETQTYGTDSPIR